MRKPEITHPEGWDHLVTPLLKLVEHVGGTVYQTKEKLGGLRVHVALPADKDWVHEIIYAVEQLCEFTCQDCGKVHGTWVGEDRPLLEVTNAPREGDSWTLTLCDICRKKEAA